MKSSGLRAGFQFWPNLAPRAACKGIPARFLDERLLADSGPTWRDCDAIAADIFLTSSLYGVIPSVILQVRHVEGDDDHGQICPEGQAEQEGSEGTEPPAANDVGLQPRQQSR